MRKRVCVHFNGTVNKQCAAGVNYDSVTPDPNGVGSALRLPCRLDPFPNATPLQLECHKNRGKCDKFREPTEEELAKHKAKIDAMFSNMEKTAPLISKIKKEHKGESWEGVEKCPVCGGRLHLSHAGFNGHVWGKCETPNCLAWME